MFKVYNHYLQKEELVDKIDLNKHWKAYLVPFDSVPVEKVEETVEETAEETPIEEEITDAQPKKRGRPKAN